MWQQARPNTEKVLTPRRPREESRIENDLNYLVDAQKQEEWVPQKPGEKPGSVRSPLTNRSKAKTKELDTLPAPKFKFHTAASGVEDSTEDSEPVEEVAAAPAPKAVPKLVAAAAAPDRMIRKISVKPKKDTQVHPESRAKAREPRETQDIFTDLKLLTIAAASERGACGHKHRGSIDPDSFEGLMSSDPPKEVQQFQGRKSMFVKRGSSRQSQQAKEAAVTDTARPWRTSGRGTVKQGGRVSSIPSNRGSVRQVLLAAGGAHARQSASGEAAHRGDAGIVHHEGVFQVGGADSSASQAASNDHDPSLWKVAVDLKVPAEIIKSAFEIFKKYASRSDGKPTRIATKQDILDLVLTRATFPKVLLMLTGAASITELPKELCQSAFKVTEDGDFAPVCTFDEFALWYARHGFSEEVLLTKRQREIRVVARKMDITNMVEIERMKDMFDSFDLDGNGTIDYSEFEKLLHFQLKVPAHLELPANRVKQFWNETDTDGSGAINFEEFLGFYGKVFAVSGNGEKTSPLETFYRGNGAVNVGPSWTTAQEAKGDKAPGGNRASRISKSPNFFPPVKGGPK